MLGSTAILQTSAPRCTIRIMPMESSQLAGVDFVVRLDLRKPCTDEVGAPTYRPLPRSRVIHSSSL